MSNNLENFLNTQNENLPIDELKTSLDPNFKIKEPPTKTPQEKLLEEFREYRKKSKEDIEKARQRQAEADLYKGMSNAFSKIGTGLASGYANVKIEPTQFKEQDFEKQARLDRKTKLENMLKEYEILSKGELTPYQQEQINLAKQRLEMSKEMTPYQQVQADIERKKLEMLKDLSPKDRKKLELEERALDLKERELTGKKRKKVSKLEEQRQKNIANRYAELEPQIKESMENIREAKELRELIKDDPNDLFNFQKPDLDTGPFEETLGDIGSFFGTEESALKQRLDALNTKAARSRLKALGETRPTDADVEQMKKAMFNISNTEEANLQKLSEYIRTQEALIDEYEQMKEHLKKGEGLENFVLDPNSQSKESVEKESNSPYGDIIEKDGKKYKWNPIKNKYQLY